MDFLQKPLAWFSNIYLRVQSKNCGRNSFQIFLFRTFSDFERKIFQTFVEKSSKFVKTTFCVSRGTICGLKYFLKVLNRFGFSTETFGMVLNFLSTCPEWKLRKKQFSDFSFQNFFRILREKIFRLSAKNFKKLSKLPSMCPEEQFVAGKFFLKFSIVLDFLQKPSAWFSNFYLRVQSKNCGRNSFLIFLLRIFSDFERKIFQTFGQKTSKSCQSNLLRVQRNSLWLEIFL